MENNQVYAIMLYASADKGVHAPLTQALNLAQLCECAYNPGAFNTPFYIHPNEDTDTEFLETVLNDYGFVWEKVHKSFSQ